MPLTLPEGYRNDPIAAERLLRVLRAARDKKLPPLDFPTPLDLLCAVEPKTVRTPALELIARELVEAYTTPGARLIISMPPQEGKSHLATKAATLWNLVRNPELKCGIVSFAAELATGFGRDIRAWITTNQGDQGTLDLRLRMARDNNSASRWQLDGHRGGLVAVGITGGLTGRALDALIIDDPFAGPDDSASEAYRERVWAWWQAVGQTRLSAGAPVVLIMTRWHEDDLAGRLLKAEDGERWRIVNIPAQADYDPAKGETDPLGRQPGQFMLSARGRDRAEWEAKKISVGTRTWNALYQGRPSPDDGGVLKRNWFRRYTTRKWSTDDGGQTYRLAEPPDEAFTSWDMSFKDTKGSDYVVGTVWARYGADMFLLDKVRARLDFTATDKAFRALSAKWPQIRVHLIEDKANGPAVISSLRKDFHGGAIIPVTPVDSKFARASAVAPFIEAGNVHLPSDDIALFTDTENNVEGLLSEAAAFPNSAHDDQVDSMTQALHRAFIAGAGAAAWTEAMRRRAQSASDASEPSDDLPPAEPENPREPGAGPARDPNLDARTAQLRGNF